MIAVTAAVAGLFSLLALLLRPGAAFGCIILAMLIWPEYLRLPVAGIAMSAPRITALVLLARLLSMGRLKETVICKVDRLVVFGWIWIIVATIVAGAEFRNVSEMIGRGFDTVLMYIVARLAIRSSADTKSFYMPLVLVAVAMAAAGLLETLSIAAPYGGLDRFRVWQWFQKEQEFRLGFARAKASTSVHIYFGLSMMIVTVFIFGARHYVKSRFIGRVALIASLTAVLSSMSSGPWIAVAMFFGFQSFAKKTALIKPVIWSLVVFAIIIEIYSNRHFYNLVDHLALNSQTAWYRTRLLEVALSQWDRYWLIGVGADWPHYWGALIDGREHVDVVNQFLILSLYGGFPATIMYIWSHIAAVNMGVRRWKRTKKPQQKDMIFSLSAAIIALDIASMSVGLFGPPLLLSNMLLGVLVSIIDDRHEEKAIEADKKLPNSLRKEEYL